MDNIIINGANRETHLSRLHCISLVPNNHNFHLSSKLLATIIRNMVVHAFARRPIALPSCSVPLQIGVPLLIRSSSIKIINEISDCSGRHQNSSDALNKNEFFFKLFAVYFCIFFSYSFRIQITIHIIIVLLCFLV